MPEMSGRELAEHLAVLRPETQVLYMSGYTDHAIVRHGILEREYGIHPKVVPTELTGSETLGSYGSSSRNSHLTSRLDRCGRFTSAVQSAPSATPAESLF